MNYTSTGYCHGAAMMVSKTILTEVGEMDESYFLYYEELDWCEQIRKKGYEIALLPSAKIWHYESVSTGGNSPLKTFYHSRNRLKLIYKSFPTLQYFLFLCYFIFIATSKFFIVNMFKLRLDLIKAHFRGIFAHLNQGVPKKATTILVNSTTDN